MIDIKQQLTTQNVIIGLLTLAVVYLMYVNYTRSCNEKYNNIGSKFSIPTGFADLAGEKYVIADTNGNLAMSNKLLLNSNAAVETPGNLSVVGTLNAPNYSAIPSGTIVAFNGTTSPSGWVLCDGGIYDKTNGTKLTATNTNSITAPDLRGRFIMGTNLSTNATTTRNTADGNNLGTVLSTNTLGQSRGEENVTLTASQIPPHSHPLPNPALISTQSSGSIPVEWGQGEWYLGSFQTTSNNTGGGQAHNNMPPYYVLTYIMKL